MSIVFFWIDGNSLHIELGTVLIQKIFSELYDALVPGQLSVHCVERHPPGKELFKKYNHIRVVVTFVLTTLHHGHFLKDVNIYPYPATCKIVCALSHMLQLESTRGVRCKLA